MGGRTRIPGLKCLSRKLKTKSNKLNFEKSNRVFWSLVLEKKNEVVWSLISMLTNAALVWSDILINTE